MPHSAPPALECGAPTQLGSDKETCRTLAEKLDTPRRHQSLPHKTKKSGACEDLRPPLFAQHNTPQVIASFKHAFGRISRRPSPLSTPFIVPSMHGCTLNHDHHTTTHLRHSDLLSMHGLHPSNVVRCVGGGYGWTRTVSSGSCMMHDDVTHTITDTQTLTDTLRSIVDLGTVSRPDSRQQTTISTTAHSFCKSQRKTNNTAQD